jgi:hypothetical protein
MLHTEEFYDLSSLFAVVSFVVSVMFMVFIV